MMCNTHTHVKHFSCNSTHSMKWLSKEVGMNNMFRNCGEFEKTHYLRSFPIGHSTGFCYSGKFILPLFSQWLILHTHTYVHSQYFRLHIIFWNISMTIMWTECFNIYRITDYWPMHSTDIKFKNIVNCYIYFIYCIYKGFLLLQPKLSSLIIK